MALTWGIVTAGRISHDFVTALATLPKGEHTVTCIAARNLKNAQDFAELHKIPVAYQGYESIAKDPTVEIVYIGALHTDHLAISSMMLEHGKHVLCEKPLCLNEKQSRQLIELAKAKNLFLMEAIWSRFFPSYQYLKKIVDEGRLGEIQSIDVEFGYNLGHSPRLQVKDLGGSVTLEQGIYPIQLSQWVFRDYPKSIEATGILNNENCDIDINCTLKYKNGGISRISANCLRDQENRAIIKGTKGTFIMNKFWCCTSIIDIDGVEKSWPLPDAEHEFYYPNTCGLRYQCIWVKECIRKGLTECSTVNHEESIRIARIEDEIRRQIGARFSVDEE